MILKLGLVVLNYNDSQRTKECVETACKYDLLANIVVVDNCSTDGSFEILKKLLSGKCDVIKSEGNFGYAYGNNYGMQYLKNKYCIDVFVISNPDVIFKENIINAFKSAFEETDYAAVSGIMKDLSGKVNYFTYWNKKTFWDDVLDCVCLLRWFKRKRNPKVINSEKQIMTVDTVHGSFFAIRSEVMVNIGYLDESTFLYYEEDIFARRLHRFGYKIGILTGVDFIHAHKSSKHILRDHKRYLKSKWTYEIKYNNINTLKKAILKVMMAYSYTETLMLIPVKNFVRICGKRK